MTCKKYIWPVNFLKSVVIIYSCTVCFIKVAMFTEDVGKDVHRFFLILCVFYSQFSGVEESSYWSVLYLAFGGYRHSPDSLIEENAKSTQKKARK